MSGAERLLTGRELVARLADLDVGHWSAAAVRRWIQEEPPCPVARRGVNGQGHRYRLVDVLVWLRARAERAGEVFDGAAALDAVTATEATNAAPAAASSAEGTPAPEAARPARAAQDPEATVRARVEAAKAGGFEDGELLDRLLGIIEGRDPRTWKATEEALSLRIKRQREAGQLVTDEELQRCLEVQQALFLGAFNGLRAQLKASLGSVAEEAARTKLVDREFDAALERIAGQVRPPLEDAA